MEAIEHLRIAVLDKSYPRYSLKGCVCYGIAISIYDGDTCDLLLSIPTEGDTIKRFRTRLLGYNSPEMRFKDTKDAAIQSRELLWKHLGGASRSLLRVECHEWDKYGRLLARIYRVEDTDTEFCVNDAMV